MTTENVLEITGLCKTYPDFALKDITLTLPEGAIMGFIGENGAGKTTTIKAVLNLIHRDAGTIRIFGQENLPDDRALKEDLGIVFADQSFPDDFSAHHIASVLKHIYTRWDTPLFRRCLADFDLPFTRPLKTFSKGMKMKLTIAAALSHHPRLLLLDEATSGLDPVIRSDMLDIFSDFIQDGHRSVLLSTHIVSDLDPIADYITFLHKGRILLNDTRDALIYDHGIVRCSRSQAETLDFTDGVARRQTDFATEVLIRHPETFRRRYPDLIVDRPTLEDLMVFYIKGAAL